MSYAASLEYTALWRVIHSYIYFKTARDFWSYQGLCHCTDIFLKDLLLLSIFTINWELAHGSLLISFIQEVMLSMMIKSKKKKKNRYWNTILCLINLSAFTVDGSGPLTFITLLRVWGGAGQRGIGT